MNRSRRDTHGLTRTQARPRPPAILKRSLPNSDLIVSPSQRWPITAIPITHPSSLSPTPPTPPPTFPSLPSLAVAAPTLPRLNSSGSSRPSPSLPLKTRATETAPSLTATSLAENFSYHCPSSGMDDRSITGGYSVVVGIIIARERPPTAAAMVARHHRLIGRAQKWYKVLTLGVARVSQKMELEDMRNRQIRRSPAAGEEGEEGGRREKRRRTAGRKVMSALSCNGFASVAVAAVNRAR